MLSQDRSNGSWTSCWKVSPHPLPSLIIHSAVSTPECLLACDSATNVLSSTLLRTGRAPPASGLTEQAAERLCWTYGLPPSSIQHPASSTSCSTGRCRKPFSRFRCDRPPPATPPIPHMNLWELFSTGLSVSCTLDSVTCSMEKSSFTSSDLSRYHCQLVFIFELQRKPNLSTWLFALIHDHRYFYHVPCYIPFLK